jgi:NNP family nitrate/nitrite transporter-like MFS transporter
VAAVCGAVFLRIFMGIILDVVGPRFGTAATLLLFAPAVFLMALVQGAGEFAAVRLFIGCSLCMFVCCQYVSRAPAAPSHP